MLINYTRMAKTYLVAW